MCRCTYRVGHLQWWRETSKISSTIKTKPYSVWVSVLLGSHLKVFASECVMMKINPQINISGWGKTCVSQSLQLKAVKMPSLHGCKCVILIWLCYVQSLSLAALWLANMSSDVLNHLLT